MTSTRLAIMTPSSNIVVEPACAGMVSALPGGSVHFARVEVLFIDNGKDSLAQFDDAPMHRACTLLSHVRPDAIAWGGTSASWLGLEWDRALVERMAGIAGCPAVTSTLSILEALRQLGITRIGLVTPYVGAIQQRVIATVQSEGLDVVAERHFAMSDNFSFGLVPETQIAEAIRDVVSEGAAAVVVLCTNLAGAGVAARIEQETGVPVLDSVTLTVWGALRTIGRDTTLLEKWGPAVSRLPIPVQDGKDRD